MKFTSVKSLSVALSIVIALSLGACGGDAPTEEAAQPADAAVEEVEEAPEAEEAEPTEAAEEAAPEETAMADEIVPEFLFTNTGSIEICELYLSPVEETTWGPDQLEGQTIPAGESFTLLNIPVGSYDARAVGCDGTELEVQLDITN